MATYLKGLLGDFTGGVGPVVGSTWKGINYMKGRQRKSTIPRSQAQLEQQAKFSLLQGFLLSMRQILMLGFKDSAIQMTGINSAYQYNYRHAITGAYPAFALNYGKVLVSAGRLLNAVDLSAMAEDDGMLKFSWTDNSGMAMANANDKCMIVVYCAEQKRSVYITTGAERSVGSHLINVGIFSGKMVETWISFIAADGADVATSIYTGQLTVL